jgi:membrane-associated phospholipid phosphatase
VPAQSSRVLLASLLLVSLLGLTFLVVLHATEPLDEWVRDYFRPGDSWGPAQIRADHVVEGLRPMVVAPVLFVAAIVASIVARSWRPAGFALLVGGLALILTELTKVLVARPDPHYATLPHSGSFPSGHTVTVFVVLGGTLLMLRPVTHLWQWLIVCAVGGAMGLALLVEGAHWLTDVVGGVLLSAFVLVLASVSQLRTPEIRRSDRFESCPHPGDAPAAGRSDAAHRQA